MPPDPILTPRGAAAPRGAAGSGAHGGGFSTLFIHRPVATTLLTLAIALAGLVGLQVLPVSPLPQIDFPTISVTAALPGASPETMAATVATPLERSLGRIAGVTEITSSSSLGNTRITLQFELSRDIDGAARDVQAAINAARSLLPTGMPSNPTYRKVNPADAPVMIVSLTSATLTRGQMYDAASTVLAQRLSQVSGVGNVTVGGGALPAVRVELDLGTLNRAGIALEDVRTAIANTNQNRPKGYVEDATTQWQIGANDQAHKAADYVPVVVAYRNGAAVRLGDVARVIDSVQDTRNAGTTNGKPSIQLQVFRQPGANIIETVDRVRALLPQLRAAMPAALDMQVVMERTGTIRASLREVERALLISVGLVVMVVFLFLRDARATLVPAVAVPVSLIGTCAVMALAGFSINNLTLMALTVATGFVVDDAVVVLENITRHVEEGRSPFAAAIRGAREVGFTVLSMSLSLVAVFIPILAMGGIVGRLFREFAVVLSVAILVSLVVSLTTTPMMAARLVRRRAGARPAPDDRTAAGSQGRGFARRAWDAVARPRLYPRIAAGYERSLGFALRHPTWTLLVLALTIAANVWLYVIVPKGFFPQQDVGFMIGGIQADQSASFQAVSGKVAELAAIVKADPAVENVMAYTGGGQRNGGFMFVTLLPVAQRGIPADQVMARLRPKMARVAGASLFLQSAQDIRIGGRQGNAQYQYTLQSDDLQQLRDWEPRIRAALAQLPELVDVNTDSQDKGLQTSLVIDRAAVARLGLSMRLIDATLNDAFGQRQVATIYEALNQYRVVMEAAPRYLERPESLNDIWIFGPPVNGVAAPVPLAAVAHWETTNTPLAVNHQSTFAASTVSFNLAPGASLGTATRAIDNAMARAGVPTAVHGGFQGGAKAFQDSLASQPILILAALVTIYIVLGVLYESLLHPLTILSTLPSAGLGALLALLATGFEFSLIALIGVILLIGIVKKNAIMMIDVAIAIERREGQDPRTAIQRACVLRLRPILMTTLAAALGALPLALSRGDGTELRQPLGIAIVGGLMVSQLLTLYTTPVVYLALDRARLRVQRWRARRHGPLGGAEAVTP